MSEETPVSQVSVETGSDSRTFSRLYAHPLKVFVNDVCVFDSEHGQVSEDSQGSGEPGRLSRDSDGDLLSRMHTAYLEACDKCLFNLHKPTEDFPDGFRTKEDGEIAGVEGMRAALDVYNKRATAMSEGPICSTLLCGKPAVYRIHNVSGMPLDMFAGLVRLHPVAGSSESETRKCETCFKRNRWRLSDATKIPQPTTPTGGADGAEGGAV